MKMYKQILVVVSVVALLVSVTARADSVPYVIYSDPTITIWADGDPVDPSGTWSQSFTVDQGHAWDQMAVAWENGLGGGFASPVLSSFSSSPTITPNFTVSIATATLGVTDELTKDLVNDYSPNYGATVSENFTVTFQGATPASGTFNFYSFYKGWGERDVYDTYNATTHAWSAGLLPAESEGNNPANPYGGYIGALNLSQVIPVPLPVSAGVGFGTLGLFGVLFAVRKRVSRRTRIA